MSEGLWVSEADGDDRGRQRFLAALDGVFGGDNATLKCSAARALVHLRGADNKRLPWLLSALDDNDVDVRSDAAAALGTLEAAGAREALSEHLCGDGEAEVRREAARALGLLGDPASLQTLMNCVLGEGYPELDVEADGEDYPVCLDVQGAALTALGLLGDKNAVPMLETFLKDRENDHVLEAGYSVMAALGSGSAQIFLRDRLAGGDDRARRLAARVLGSVSETDEVTEALIGALGDLVPDVRIAAAWSLSRFEGDVAAVPVSALLGDSDEDVRIEIIEILSGFRGETVVRNLELLVKDPRARVKRAAVHALGKVGSPSCCDTLVRLIDTCEDSLCYEAVEVLGQLGDEARTFVLVNLLGDARRAPDLRMEAANALGEIMARSSLKPGDAPEAGLALRAAVGDENRGVAMAALSGLWAADARRASGVIVSLFGPQESVQTHAPEVKDETRFERPDPVTSTIGAILARAHDEAAAAPDKTDDKSGDKVDERADDPERRLKLLGLRLAGSGTVDEPDLKGLVIECAGSPDFDFRLAAVRSLGAWPGRDVNDVLTGSLADVSPDIRLAALQGLAGRDLDEQDCVQALIADEDGDVRWQVVMAARAPGQEVCRATISAGLVDENQRVCAAALHMLESDCLNAQASDRLARVCFRFSGALRLEAGRALARTRCEAGAQHLLDVLGDSARQEDHWICLDALCEIYAPNSGSA